MECVDCDINFFLRFCLRPIGNQGYYREEEYNKLRASPEKYAEFGEIMKTGRLAGALAAFMKYLIIMLAAVIGIFSVLSNAAYGTVPDWKELFDRCVKGERTVKDVVKELTAGDAGVQVIMIDNPSDVITHDSYKKLPVASAVAASTLTEEYSVMNLFDDDLSTTWQEGADGYGIGEDLRISFDKVYKIKYIAFDLGNRSSDEAYTKNGRPKVVTLQIEECIQLIRFRDVRETQWIELSKPIAADSMRILINDAYKGSTYTDNCISNITVYGK